MLRRNNCRFCNNEVEKAWNFCPKCGKKIAGLRFPSIFQRKGNTQSFRLGNINVVIKSMGSDESSELQKKDEVFKQLDIDDFFKDSGFDHFFGKPGSEDFLKKSRITARPIIAEKQSSYPENESSETQQIVINPQTKQKKRVVKEVFEPETKIKNQQRIMEIEVQMPGISKNDIEINKFGESLEIRGYGKNKTYFKVVPIPPKTVIQSKQFSKGNLKIKIGRNQS